MIEPRMFLKTIPRRRMTSYKGMLKDILFFTHQKKDYVTKFEKAFAKYHKVKYAIATPTGRTALRFILQSLDLKPNDEVIFPAYTLAVLPKIILDLGLKPVIVDINKDTLNIDVNILKRKITKKTKAIIATHLFGFPCDINKILNISKKRNIKVIEDCAHSLGATYNHKKVGTFGYASYYSFELVKGINTFGGGMVLTNDSKLYKKLKEECTNLPKSSKRTTKKVLFSYFEDIFTKGILSNITLLLFYFRGLKQFLIKTYKKLKTSVRNVDYGYTELQAFLGLKQLKEIDKKNKSTLSNALYLTGLLKKQIPKQKPLKNAFPVYYQYVIRNRNISWLYQRLITKKIDTSIGSDIMDNCGKLFGKQRYPVADEVYKTTIQIPVYPELTKKDIAYIARNINRFSSK